MTNDLPDERLRAGDVGVVVEHSAARDDVPEGYEVECFAATGETVAVVSVVGVNVCPMTGREVLSVREFALTS